MTTESLRPLLWPVYIPTFVYAAGAAAIVPAQVLLALSLGFSAQGIAALVTFSGACAVVGSLLAGRIVDALGERRALIVVTVLGAAGLLAVGLAADPTRLAASRALLIAALSVLGLMDSVWGIARQGAVVDLSPPGRRGQAMNLYGACQRMGRVVGPVIAAGIIALTSSRTVFLAAAALIVAALVVIARTLPGHVAPTDPQPAAEASAEHRRARRGLFLLGVGILALAAVRTAKESLIPLWAATGVHLTDERVALVMGLVAAMELVLFWPAGLALDRIGRTPVVVAALATIGLGFLLMPLSRTPGWFLIASIIVGLGDGMGAGIVKTIGADLAPSQGRGRFLGQWQSVAAIGSLAAPALAGAVISAISLAAALPVMGVIGLLGAAWMAHWTPKFIPRPRR